MESKLDNEISIPGGFIKVLCFEENELYYLSIMHNNKLYCDDNIIVEFLEITFQEYENLYINNNIKIVKTLVGDLFFKSFNDGILALKIIKDNFENLFFIKVILNE